MKRLYARIKELWLVWVTAVLLLLVFVNPFWTFPDSTKWGAWTFQVLASFALLRIIEEKRSQANLPNIWEQARVWLASIVGRSYVLEAEGGAYGVSGSDARAEVWRAPKSPSPEDRLYALEQNIAVLREQLSITAKELQTAKLGLVEAIKSERAEREAAIRELDKIVKEFAVGSVHIESTAAIWQVLAMGLTLANVLSQ